MTSCDLLWKFSLTTFSISLHPSLRLSCPHNLYVCTVNTYLRLYPHLCTNYSISPPHPYLFMHHFYHTSDFFYINQIYVVYMLDSCAHLISSLLYIQTLHQFLSSFCLYIYKITNIIKMSTSHERLLF